MIRGRIISSEGLEGFDRLARAEGALLWDEKGNEYIDFTSGWNVVNTGWNNQEIADAVKRQADKNVYTPLWVPDPIQDEYAEVLCDALPEGLDMCAKATGGVEAVEEAIKIARAATRRRKIIGFKNSYHGQLFAALALGSADAAEEFGPLVPNVIQMAFPPDDSALETFLAKLEKELKHEDVAAMVTEAGMITGSGDLPLAPEGYLAGVRTLTKKYGTLLILDEVGTGFSRTGKLFAMQHEGVVPDLVAFAKGITNGAGALGAVVMSAEVTERGGDKAHLSSTFGWNPLACSAALKVLAIHQRDELWLHAQIKGQKIKAHLEAYAKDNPAIIAVRGQGMEIAVQLADEIFVDVQNAALQRGLHITGNDTDTLQIMPPITIDGDLLDRGLQALTDAIEKIA